MTSPQPRNPSPELRALDAAANERAQLAAMLQESVARAEEAATRANRERTQLMEEQREAARQAAEERRMLMDAISAIRASIPHPSQTMAPSQLPQPPPMSVPPAADESFEHLTAELARSRRQGSKICMSNDLGDHLGQDVAAVLNESFPVYAWPKDDRLSGIIIRALAHMTTAARQIGLSGKETFRALLSTKMAALGRWATPEQAAELQAALLTTSSNPLDWSVVILAELSLLGNGDFPPEVVPRLRLARLVRPSTGQEVAEWLAGRQVVPVSDHLVPTKCATRRIATEETARLPRKCRDCGREHVGPWKTHTCAKKLN